MKLVSSQHMLMTKEMRHRKSKPAGWMPLHLPRNLTLGTDCGLVDVVGQALFEGYDRSVRHQIRIACIEYPRLVELCTCC